MPNVVEIILTGKDLSEKSFNKAAGNLLHLQGAAGGAAAAMTAAVATGAAMAAALVEMTASAIESADALGKNAQKAGVSVDDFSRLAFAAGLVNISQEQLVKSMKNLSDFMAKQGLASESLRDELLSVADQFHDMPDGIAKTNRAVELFGRTGQDLIPLLNQGSKALRDQFDEAEKLGVAFGSDLSDKAQEFNDNLHKLKQAVEGVGFQLASELLPRLVELTKTLVDVVRDGDNLKTFLSIARGGFYALAEGIDTATTSGKSFLGVFERAGDKMSADFIAKMLGGITGPAMKSLTSLAPDKSDVEIINPADVEKAADLMAKMKAVVATDLDKINQDVRLSYNERLKIIEEFKVSAEQQEDLLVAAFAEQEAKQLQLSQELYDKKHDLAIQMEQATREGIEREKEALDAAYVDRINQIRALGLATDENNRFMELANKEHLSKMTHFENDQNTSRLTALQETFSHLSSAAQAFGQKGFAAYKIFASAEAIVSTALGVTKALGAFAPPFNFIAAAAVAAAGAAQVAVINSQSAPGGAAHGGIDFVPDERTFLLSRGERVLQPAANEDLTNFLSGEGDGGSRQIVIHNYIGTDQIGTSLFNLSRDGRLTIAKNAIV